VTRTTTRIAVLAVALVVAVAIVLRTGREQRIGDVFDVPGLGEQVIPELLQRIRDFHRVVTRRGEKILEISAREASYYRDRAAIEIVEPRLVFFHQGERVGSIEADKGTLVIDNTELASADLAGNVRLTLTKFEIAADSMRYDRPQQKIQARGVTKVASPEIELEGRDMLFDLRAQKLTVDSGVAMHLKQATKVEP
jgi:LPS export ABC transporter protein LptC